MRHWSICAVTIVVLLLLPISFGDSFAIHQSDGITWQLIVISSYPACSLYHYYMLDKYNEITKSYLDLYQLENVGHKPVCLTESQYENEFETPDDVDLLVLVFDRNKGRAELHPHELGGFYSHVGNEWTHNHTIVLCDCSNFKFSDPVWILSHELSHFVLNYLDFDLEAAEKTIHALDAKYDYCVEVEYDSSCSSVKTTIKGDTGNWVVMTPYQQAIGKSLMSNNENK